MPFSILGFWFFFWSWGGFGLGGRDSGNGFSFR